MKRLLIRLGVLTGLVVVGLIAIAQAQRSLHSSQQMPTEAASTADGAPPAARFSIEPVADAAANGDAYPGDAPGAIAQVQYQEPVDATDRAPSETPSEAPYDPTFGGANAPGITAAEAAPADPNGGGYFQEFALPTEPTAADGQAPEATAAATDAPADAPWSEADAGAEPAAEPQLLAAGSAEPEFHALNTADETLELQQPAELIGEIVDPAAEAAPADDEPALGPAAAAPAPGRPSSSGVREPKLLVVDPEEATIPNEPQLNAAQPARRSAPRSAPAASAESGALDPFEESAAAALPATRTASSRSSQKNRLASASSEIEAPAAEVTTAGNGQPGGRELEGVQAPSLAVEKIAPDEVQVGTQVTFQTRVRNAGTVAAREVEIHDEVPRGARLVGTKPRAERGPRGELIWNIGTLRAGEEVIVSMDVVPQTEGELGSVATARFAADASMRTVATRPALALDVEVPGDVLIGQQLAMAVRITNTGTGAATNVVLTNQLPEQFEHPAGPDLEYTVGTLKPGETRDIALSLKAVKPGKVASLLVAEGDGQLRADSRSDLEVLAPALDLAIEGPQKRYLNRQAEYTVTLANPGTAPAHNVELATRLSPGLEFVDANNLGEYDEQTRTVHWRLEELPAGESGTVVVTAVPIEEGEQRLLAQTASDDGLQAEKEQVVLVEGIAGTSFEVVDASDPIEIGGDTIYEIRVVNQGTKASTNIHVVAIVPDGMQPTAADGPVGHAVQGSQIVFEPLDRLAPKAETTYRLKVQAKVAGDLRLRVQVTSDDMRTPVTKEESTRVYADE